MHIGLIGGIGPVATSLYYKRITQRCSERGLRLELTMVHADIATLLDNQAHGDTAAQLTIYTRLTQRLRAAGADRLVVPSISGHFCLSGTDDELPLPIIDLIESVNDILVQKQYSRVGILGTHEAMATRLYGRLDVAHIVELNDQSMADVHAAYVAMASRGFATDKERTVIENAYDELVHSQGAETVILGGTDLALVFDERSDRQNVLDCAATHIEAIVERIAEKA